MLPSIYPWLNQSTQVWGCYFFCKDGQVAHVYKYVICFYPYKNQNLIAPHCHQVAKWRVVSMFSGVLGLELGMRQSSAQEIDNYNIFIFRHPIQLLSCSGSLNVPTMLETYM